MDTKLIAEALDRNLTSPNVSDANGEDANIVDTTDHIASALLEIARALDGIALVLNAMVAKMD